jgi:hypothetical protein
MQMLRNRLLIPLLVALCLMLAAAGIAYADLKAVSVVDGWDEATNKYAHSLNEVTFDGHWVSYLHSLSFDNDPYVQANPAYPSAACPDFPNRTTKWAGVMEFGLYNVDNSPLGAPGWLESRAWQLVACDRDGDSDFDGRDLAVQPMDYVLPYTGGTLTVITKDLRTGCTTGNCEYEIVTTIFINTDSDCDGVQNTDLPVGGLCFYAEARTPVIEIGSPLLWSGNIQTRISSGGGDKTVNYHVDGTTVGTTAIRLSSFTAKLADARSSPVTLPAMVAMVGVAAVGAVTWRLRRARW